MKPFKILPAVIFLLLATLDFLVVGADDDVAVLVGETVTLECPVLERCGGLHSIRWYKDEERIALLAEAAQLINIEGKLEKRIEMTLTKPGELKIPAAELSDEGRYRCDLTYLEPIDNCKSVHTVNLRTLQKPKSLTLYDENNKEVNNGEMILGGLLEDGDTTVECRAVGGRPSPTLIWTLNNKIVSGDVSKSGEDENALTINKLVFTNERKLHGAKLKCTASSEALSDPLEVEISLNLILRPTNLGISGVEQYVVQGSKVTLECLSEGANPPAIITWMNETDILPDDQILTTTAQQADGTFNSISRLSFWATRWENNKSFNCESRQKAAPLETQDMHMNASKILIVHYPPIVYVEPDNITVNETAEIQLFCAYDANPRKLLNVVWIQNDVELDVKSNPDDYAGADVDDTSLIIKNTSEDDIGKYYCKVTNTVGSTKSTDFVEVDVHFTPEVQVIMDVDGYIIESEKQNVLLECAVMRGNPFTLLEVGWFLDDEALKYLPECNSTDDSSVDLCSDVAPNRLLLEKAGTSFHGNYSCKGKSLAGWGPLSNYTELIVYYEPGPATIVYSPQHVVKDQTVTLTCSVKDRGRPSSNKFLWYRGTQLIEDVDSSNWTIDVVNLETEANFSCSATNEAGIGVPAVVYIDVFAPPSFISDLTPTTGILYNSSEVSLSCRVECSPLCRIEWFKNGINLTTSDKYIIVENILPADSRINRFESLESNLTFNLDNWPDNILNRLTDNDNYTCLVIDNGIGPSINSSTALEVEFPPENMTVSNKVVSVTEDLIPEKIICTAKAKPKPKYRWFRYKESPDKSDDDITSDPEILSTGHALSLKKGVLRSDSGDLICEAYNDHGALQITTYLNVMFKPECTLVESETDQGRIITCTAIANPTEVYFEWSLQDGNDTISEEAIVQNGAQSVLKLDEVTSTDDPRTFVCVANNTVGVSSPCTLVVKGILPWWKWWSKTALLVAAGIGILLILVILLCLIILCICRRRRAASKYNTPTLDDQESSPIQNETSIIQAIVSQSMPGISKSQSPTTPTQYSEKSRLVSSHNKCIIPQNKPSPNKNPLATYQNSGKLQADLSLLEASYQAGLIANKQKSLSNCSVNDNTLTRVTNVTEVNSAKTTPQKNIETQISSNNNTITEEMTKVNSESQGLTVNKWPLKPGVLVHVNSNHSLSPKKFSRNVIKPPDDEIKTNVSDVDEKQPENDKKNESPTNDIVSTEKSENIDITKCKNIMKSNSLNKRSTISNILKKMDFIVGIGKNNKDQTDDILSVDSSNEKRCKSNKMALSLIGFVHKDNNEKANKSRGIKGFFQSDSRVIIASEGVVTFRRPNNTNNLTQRDVTIKNDTQSIKKDLNDNSEHFDTSTESRSSSNSRKRKKPGEAPTNAGAEGANQGLDNPGLYENLPFHGMQQAPNKPVQVIQPVVRALAIKTNSKSPEAILERQLQCNPSFTPRILSCPPYSHQSNLNLNSLPNTTVEINHRSNQNVLFSPHTLSKNSTETYSNIPTELNSDENQNERVNKDDNIDDQKFYSLNVKRERIKKSEPRFNSMKIVRKRKLDRFYPSKHRIDYIIINKNTKNPDCGNTKTNEVVYANYQHILYPSLSNRVENNAVNDSFQGSFQNLTDSIQIHENSSIIKTPTPAPRSNKSIVTEIEIINSILPKDHVYANVSLHISKQNSKKKAASHHEPPKYSNFNNIQLTDTPKTLPRKCLKSNVCKNIMIVAKNSEFNASTFPKRTTKSGKLLDPVQDKSICPNKSTPFPKGKVITSKSPSRNHSFNDALIKPHNIDTEKTVPITKNITNTMEYNNLPSIIDATPKSSVAADKISKSHSDGKMETELEMCWEKLLKPGKIEYMRKKPARESKNIGKVIPKQQMLIKPPDVPLQIPNLTAKPIPKTQSIQLKRSQSSLSGKGISSEYLQQYKGETGLQDGSLVRAKIRELSLRQNVNNIGMHHDPKVRLNQTHPSDPPQKSNQNQLQKHHSFCYFQPIHSIEESNSSHRLTNCDTNEQIGPLIYKPNTTKRAIAPHDKRLWIDKKQPFLQIDPEHKKSFDKLHDLLKRDPADSNAQKRTPAVNTYTLNSLNRHKYVPKDNDNNNVKQRKIVYADLDLDNHNKQYNEKVNTNKRLFSKDKIIINNANKIENKNTISSTNTVENKRRTEYATLKFGEAYRPNIADQLIYADADPKDYGPINYKQASIYARMKKVKEQQKMELQRTDEEE